MKIAVFGATGATGKVFMTLALDAGHELVALVRDKSKLEHREKEKDTGARLRAVVGDATDGSAVHAVIEGADAVVSCLGHVPGGACPMMSIAYSHIVTAAAKQENPPRCVLLTTMGEAACLALFRCMLNRGL